VLENALNAPKASAGEHRGLEPSFLIDHRINSGRRHDARFLGRKSRNAENGGR
jgi:hypothetical protein